MSVMKHFAMSICMCKKVSVNYGQPVRLLAFVFFHKTEWVIMIFMILNLEGHQNCMIASKVTTILMQFFSTTKNQTPRMPIKIIRHFFSFKTKKILIKRVLYGEKKKILTDKK